MKNTVGEVEKIANGINEVPEARIDFISRLGDLVPLTLSVKGDKNAYHVFFGDMLFSEGVVSPYDILFLSDGYHAVENIFFTHFV